MSNSDNKEDILVTMWEEEKINQQKKDANPLDPFALSAEFSLKSDKGIIYILEQIWR